MSDTVRDIMEDSFVLIRAEWTWGRTRRYLADRHDSHVIITREGGQYFYLFERGDFERMTGDLPDGPIMEWDALHEHTATEQVGPEFEASFGDEVVVVENGSVIGFLHPSSVPRMQSSEPPPKPRNRSAGGTRRKSTSRPRSRTRKKTAVRRSKPRGLPTREVIDELPKEIPTTFSAHPDLKTPLSVEPSETFDIIVGFRRDQDPSLDHSEEIFIPDADPEEGMMVIMTAEGGTLDSNMGTLELSLVSTAPFKCTPAADASEVILTAQYFYENTQVGVAKRTVPIGAENVATGLPVSDPAPMTAGSVEGVDLVINVKVVDGGLLWNFIASDAGISEGPFQVDIADTAQFARDLDQLQKDDEYRGLLANSTLLNLGKQIADRMPDRSFEIVREVGEAIDEVPKILLLTDEPFIPWELALFDGPLIDDEAPPFLSAQTRMGRWWIDSDVITPPPADQPIEKISAVASKFGLASGHRELPEAIAEQETLAQKYEADKLEATKEELAVFLGPERTPNHLIHFAVHGFSDPDANRSAIIMADGKRLNAETLIGSYRMDEVPRFSVFFFNACQTGTAGTSLGQAAGFPGTLVKGGARCFIAPLWEVHDKDARSFAENFYEATLEENRPVADVLREQRSSYKPTGSTTPLAYIYYGHPALKLTISPHEHSHV